VTTTTDGCLIDSFLNDVDASGNATPPAGFTQRVGSSAFTCYTADKIQAALLVLAVTQAGQVLMQGSYVLLRERGEMTRVLRSWRTSGLVGLLASLGSAGWFTGFALAPVALVRTVGQVEVLFTLGFGHLYLREKTRRHEVIALFCVAAGVALALMGSL
jgi:drug/metabolite transporter (DMT)-like permease